MKLAFCLKSIAFAEEKWTEREASFTAQIAQLQALVASQVENAGSEVASEAGDGALADLEEDEAWAKVERGKRKAVLLRERDALAKCVRTNLSKVSTASSPFKKASA